MLRVPGWCLHCLKKEPLPVTSTFYYPENMPQGDGASDKGMPGMGEERRPWSK